MLSVAPQLRLVNKARELNTMLMLRCGGKIVMVTLPEGFVGPSIHRYPHGE